jgi:hypothetical protein
MDSGEGRYFNETFGNQQDSVGFYLRKDRIVSGSRVLVLPKPGSNLYFYTLCKYE